MNEMEQPEPLVNGVMGVRELQVTAKQVVDRIAASNEGGKSEDSAPLPGNAGPVNVPVGKGPLSPRVSVDGQISAEQKAVEQLLKAVDKWVQEAQQESESADSSRPPKEIESLHWVYSIESYLRSLDTDWTAQKNLTHKIASQLLNFFRQLFHFQEKDKAGEYNWIYPHWEVNAGLASATQLSLYAKFPELADRGFQWEEKSPVIYCSDQVIGQQICSKVGLPYGCISVLDFTSPSWIQELEGKLKADVEAQRVPVALLMNTAVANLEKGLKLAESFNVWVHFYGNNVLAYFLKRPESTSLGSSLTIDLTRWLKNPKLPFLTLLKRPEKMEPKILDLFDIGSPRNEIMCFTPWFVAHVYGKTRLTTLVNEAVYRGKFLLEIVKRFVSLAVVPNWSTLSDGSVILSTLTFQFRPEIPHFIPHFGQGSKEKREHSAQYLDTLNSWLYHILERDLRDILPLEFVFVEGRGWNIHCDVIRMRCLSSEDEAAVLATFINHMAVLQATVNQKLKFQELVDVCEEMEWVNNENQWAGLGAVRYIPSSFRAGRKQALETQAEVDKENEKEGATAETKKTDGKEKEIDHLNAQIVNKLRAIDSAFSLGEGRGGQWCVQFGMVTEETDVAELVRLVASTGQEIEESSEFFQRMSELVRKGIHEAEEELRKESEEALWEEGILRRVPIVGTFVSWFSPPVKESGIRGRALNLTQGTVESTENIYKYHMQVTASTFASKPQDQKDATK